MIQRNILLAVGLALLAKNGYRAACLSIVGLNYPGEDPFMSGRLEL